MAEPAIEVPNQVDLVVSISEQDHAQGSAEAPITLVEYGDYECPDCFDAQPVVTELRKKLGDRLRFVFRHFPQSSIHPRASAAAQAAEAAGYQRRFWEMHRALFQHQKELISLDLTHLALQLGLEVYRFEVDSESATAVRKVSDDFSSGLRSGVHGTPTFFINERRYIGPNTVAGLLAGMGVA